VATGSSAQFEALFKPLGKAFRISAFSPGKDQFATVFDDITDRKQAEAEHERLMTAIDQTGEVIVITAPDGTIQFVNPAFERSTGYTREEAIGKNPRILKSGNQDDAFYRDLWQTISSGKPWQGVFSNKRKDGALYTEEATISPVRNAAGAIVNYVAVKRDITEQLRLESQIQQAQKMESVGRLAGGVAHDFNNMLQVILGYAEMALEGAAPSSALHNDISEIRNAARRSSDLTRQLLAFARKQTISPRVFDLNEAGKSMLTLLQRLIGEDITLAWKPEARPAMIKMDPAQLDQILTNLSINARDAIAGVGTLTVATGSQTLDEAFCSLHVDASPGDYVVLTVSDNGIGMTPETLSHIFEPFYTTKGGSAHTGLGLSTVYGIVKQNNGFISLESSLGKGTTFAIYLPRHKGEALPSPAPVSATPGAKGREMLLLVDDESTILSVSQRMLESLGYRVLAAETPDKALLLAADPLNEIDLLITDVVMPGLSGPDLAKRLTAQRPGLKCLFVSGYAANVITDRGMMEKDLDFLPKPFNRDQLAKTVRAILDRR
jgi:PAS domain S-box-containing protein